MVVIFQAFLSLAFSYRRPLWKRRQVLNIPRSSRWRSQPASFWPSSPTLYIWRSLNGWAQNKDTNPSPPLSPLAILSYLRTAYLEVSPLWDVSIPFNDEKESSKRWRVSPIMETRFISLSGSIGPAEFLHIHPEYSSKALFDKVSVRSYSVGKERSSIHPQAQRNCIYGCAKNIPDPD